MNLKNFFLNLKQLESGEKRGRDGRFTKAKFNKKKIRKKDKEARMARRNQRRC